MKKILLFWLILMGACCHNIVAAPRPQYYCGLATPVHVYPWCTGCSISLYFDNSGAPNDTQTLRMQFIYKPKFFKGAKPGKITAVYVRVGQLIYTPVKLTTSPHYEVWLGNTDQAGYKPVGTQNVDTFLETTQVFSADNYPMQASDSLYGWIKIPLNKGSFTYTTTSNLVVELRSGSPSPQHPFRYLISPGSRDTGNLTGMAGNTLSRLCNAGGMDETLLDFGFDINGATEVEGPSVEMSEAISVYPNPTSDKLHLSGAIQDSDYQILDLAGRQVQRGQVPADATLPLSELAPGSYLLQVRAKDNMPRQTLRFVKQ